MLAAIGQHGIDGHHVVHHIAVANRTRATGIIARHAPQGGLRTGRHVHRKPPSVFAQPGIQGIQNDAGFHLCGVGIQVEREQTIEVLAGIDHQRLAHRLTALRAAGAARQHRDPLFAGDLHGSQGIGFAVRHDHANGLNLIDRGIGGVAPAAC